MDFKGADNLLYLVGDTREELGGSHLALVNNLDGGVAPQVDAERAKATFAAIHRAMTAGLVAACHDLSEGGLATAAAEMAFAGGMGAEVHLDAVPGGGKLLSTAAALFSESNTRFLCEVTRESAELFEAMLTGVPHACIGKTTDDRRLRIIEAEAALALVDASIDELKEAWQRPLRW
jgi:phosphoribosylformylglycinamidine synthase